MHMSRIRGGICTVEPSDPRQDVIDRAIYLFKQQKGFEDYHVARNNCEDFALYCKTEHMIREKLATRGSDQVNSILEKRCDQVEPVFLKVVFRTPLSPVMVAVTLGLCI
ncbi:putative LRAT domain-containing protein [Helianthus debilis subsp. tardiflorus]